MSVGRIVVVGTTDESDKATVQIVVRDLIAAGTAYCLECFGRLDDGRTVLVDATEMKSATLWHDECLDRLSSGSQAAERAALQGLAGGAPEAPDGQVAWMIASSEDPLIIIGWDAPGGGLTELDFGASYSTPQYLLLWAELNAAGMVPYDRGDVPVIDASGSSRCPAGSAW